MNVSRIIERIKKQQGFDGVGMILCHNGVVRGTSRDGRRVSGLRVAVDHQKLDRLIAEKRKIAGIFAIHVEIAENKTLSVGDDVMLLVVAGDIRENVIAVLQSTLEAGKKIYLCGCGATGRLSMSLEIVSRVFATASG